MVVTVAQLLQTEIPLTKLRAENLGAVANYRVSRLIAKLVSEIQPAHQSKIDIFKKYGAEANGMIQVPPVNMEFLNAELAPLFAAEVDLPDIKPLPLELLEPAKTLTVQDLIDLGPFVQNGDGEKP